MHKLFFSLLLCPALSFAQHKLTAMHNTDSLKRAMARQKAENRKQAAKTQFQYFVVRAENNTFGYDIYADGNLYIHQYSIPAVGTNKGFADTAAAGATARLVIKKIQQGESPPSVTIEELKKIKAL